MTDLPTEPGSVIEAKPPGRRKAFLMALDTDGRWRRLDGPFYEDGPFREVHVLFDAGCRDGDSDAWHRINMLTGRPVFGKETEPDVLYVRTADLIQILDSP